MNILLVLFSCQYTVSYFSGPADKKQAHPDGITQLRWCKCSDNLLATIGHPGCQVKLFNIKGQQVSANKNK